MTAGQLVRRLGTVGGVWTLLHVYIGWHLLGHGALAGPPLALA